MSDMSKWIKVEDKLPEIGRYVLVTCKSGFSNRPSYFIELAKYYGNDSWMLSDDEYNVPAPVIAWQEPPKPYIEPEFINAEFDTVDNYSFIMKTAEDYWPENHYMVLYTGTHPDGKTFMHKEYFETEKQALDRADKLFNDSEVRCIHVNAYNGGIIKNVTKSN